MKRLIFAQRRVSLLTSASTITYSIAAIPQPSGLSNNVNMPKFNAALGSLYKVQIQLAATARSISRIENTSATAAPGTQSGVNFVQTAFLNGTSLLVNNLQVLFTNNLGAYDNLSDYGGSSGVSNARRVVTNTQSAFLHASLNDLFVGEGNITFNVTNTASAFAIGPLNFLLSVTPEIGFSLTVTYYYIENVSPTVISGIIWEDYNANGVMEPGEPGLAGVILSLLDEFGSPTSSAPTTTNADGYYEFTGLAPGNYYVVYELPSGYTVTTDLDGADVSNSMFVTASSGQTTNANVGMAIPPPPIISGIIWEDVNGNGIIDIDEPRLSGITVSLLDQAGTPTGLTATSDVNGLYTFNLPSAGIYQISYTVPEGYIATFDADGVDANNIVSFSANAGEIVDLFHIGFQLAP